MDSARINAVAKHWIESSNRDFKTMNHLFKSKDYAWSLFVGHLVLEKLLKANYVLKTNRQAPFTHNLSKIADKCGMQMSDETKELFDIINSFNLEARYDSEKKVFYRRCTKSFTLGMVSEIKKLRLWIKGQL